MITSPSQQRHGLQPQAARHRDSAPIRHHHCISPGDHVLLTAAPDHGVVIGHSPADPASCSPCTAHAGQPRTGHERHTRTTLNQPRGHAAPLQALMNPDWSPQAIQAGTARSTIERNGRTPPPDWDDDVIGHPCGQPAPGWNLLPPHHPQSREPRRSWPGSASRAATGKRPSTPPPGLASLHAALRQATLRAAGHARRQHQLEVADCAETGTARHSATTSKERTAIMPAMHPSPAERRHTVSIARGVARNAAVTTSLVLASSGRATGDVEPLAGMLAARDLGLAARDTALGYIRQAREGGHSWQRIGATMRLFSGADPHLPGQTFAEAAFAYAAGDPRTETAIGYGRSFTWSCHAWDTSISDHGLCNGPADDEHGHAPDCPRLAAVAEWEAGQ